MTTSIRGIRGATQLRENTADELCDSTVKLLLKMLESNSITTGGIIQIVFSCTPDINAGFPASYARKVLGLGNTPMLDVQHMAVPDDLPLCLRVLMTADTYGPVVHTYLNGTQALRPDLG